MFAHYFNSREEAKRIVDFLWSLPYELRDNEVSRPTYKIIKIRNISSWYISRIRHYDSRDSRSFFTDSDYDSFRSLF